MKLIFLGTSSAFTTDTQNYQSNMLLKSSSGKHMLIDCGSDVRRSLYNVTGLSYREIDAVYISHLHADHAGGLEWLGFTRKFNPGCTKPTLFISEALQKPLWERTLSGGMRSLDSEEAQLSTYFSIQAIPSGGSFEWEGTRFTLIPTLHFKDGKELAPSFGLWIQKEKAYFLTTDTQFTPDQFMQKYESADIIFHDCETNSHRSGVHANYQDLKTLPVTIKKKMWLYHYNPGELPLATSDGFAGFVKPGQSFALS